MKTAIVTLARRVQAINTEIAALDAHIDTLVRATAPALLDLRRRLGHRRHRKSAPNLAGFDSAHL